MACVTLKVIYTTMSFSNFGGLKTRFLEVTINITRKNVIMSLFEIIADFRKKFITFVRFALSVSVIAVAIKEPKFRWLRQKEIGVGSFLKCYV